MSAVVESPIVAVETESSAGPVRVGFIGAGSVLWAYLQMLDRLVPRGLAREDRELLDSTLRRIVPREQKLIHVKNITA